MARVRALLLPTVIAALSLGLALPAGALMDTDPATTDDLLDTSGELLDTGDDLLGTTEALLGPLDAVFDDDDEYHDPFFLNWPAFTPAVPGDLTASTERDCPNGSVKCIDNVVREMTRRWERLGCDHNAVFALTYLLTTEEYRRAVSDRDFFADNAHVNHQAAVFADLYFQPFDAWYHKGRKGTVPPAWRVAFHAADEEAVTGTGNMLLGMNAHIRRDLPFVLNAVGLVAPDGESRKPDHDRVNLILNAVAPTVTEETAARYDPSIAHGNVQGTTLDDSLRVQVVAEWREEAWRKAELLANAEDETELLDIAEMIERDATASAVLIVLAYGYDDVLRDASDRNAHCAAHLDGS
jgi:hypothetical protein